jgi:hypothetical protein
VILKINLPDFLNACSILLQIPAESPIVKPAQQTSEEETCAGVAGTSLKINHQNPHFIQSMTQGEC